MADSQKPENGKPSQAPPPTAVRRFLWRYLEQHIPNISLAVIIALFLALVLYPYMVVNLDTAEVGVLWKRFDCGTVMEPDKLKDEGLHIILPWDRLFRYDLRLQSTTETYNAISRDGASLGATINIRFMLNRDSVPLLHEAFGPRYIETAVKPEIGSRTREIMARHTSEEVYTQRSLIENEIKQVTETRMAAMLRGMGEDRGAPRPLGTRCGAKVTEVNRHDLARSVNLISTLVLGIELPPPVVMAINRKLEQLYISQEYVFRVERERRESERKQIEAIGIRDFQQTVSQGISDSYLRWRGIEATLQLAQSTNSKIVIVGGGRDGLPIILGNVDSVSTPSSGTAASDDSATKPTAPSPGRPVEKTPSSGLSTPSEKTPESYSSASPETNVGSGSESSSGARIPIFPLNFSDLKAWLSRSAAPAESRSNATKPEEARSTETKPFQGTLDESGSARAKPDETKSSKGKPAR